MRPHYCLGSGTRPDVRVSVNVDAVKSPSPCNDAPEPWVRVFQLRGCTKERGSPKRTAVGMFQGSLWQSSLYTETVTANITGSSVSSMDAP